jgi:hypothetical protein
MAMSASAVMPVSDDLITASAMMCSRYPSCAVYLEGSTQGRGVTGESGTLVLAAVPI